MSVIFSNVTKKYSDRCGVFNLSFKIRDGNTVALLGRNWAGKTNTIKLLMNLIHKDEGNIQLVKINAENEK